MSAPLLVFGWGNLSRGDDALGPLFVQQLRLLAGADAGNRVDFLEDYQLQIEHALDLAEGRAELLKYEALDAARLELDAEHGRLVALRAVNPSIAAAEVDAIATERDALLAAIPQARLRLDAVRFVVSPDFLSLR